MKMTQEDRDEWVAALRSGKYQQGVGTLLEPSSNVACCLGVLCDLQAAKGVVKKNVAHAHTRFANPKHTLEYSSTALPKILQERFSCEAGVKVYYKGRDASLVRLNDAERLPFSAIADIIEDQVEIIPFYST